LGGIKKVDRKWEIKQFKVNFTRFINILDFPPANPEVLT
jgi:hypothetical protein